MPTSWSPAAVRLVGGWQEELYVEIGEQLGLGSYAPKQAFDRLAKPQIPREILSFDGFAQFLGPQAIPEGTAAHYNTVVDDYISRYAALVPPTNYEEPNLFGVLNELLDTVQDEASGVGFNASRDLLIGTLPIGSIHAASRLLGSKGEIVILFQHSLASFQLDGSYHGPRRNAD